ncbi:hypothetical protein PPROV_000388900 [Pycnococcus provasolii]|uniref:Prolyl endopeptidase n=3 Tax=Pycnococcus provasolii TaxID=41880 RepID=A0A830HJD4_9CHLO|nr:hypothetical protein PPROV_000388900 [Pycnococcus provasolii]
MRAVCQKISLASVNVNRSVSCRSSFRSGAASFRKCASSNHKKNMSSSMSGSVSDAASSSSSAMPGPLAESSILDSRIWLEDVLGEKCLDWVREQNDAALTSIGNPALQPEYATTLAALDSREKIPHGVFRGGYIYNFWQDANNKQGLWRRAPYESYVNAKSADDVAWDIVLDLDKLSADEGMTWVWKGARVLDEGPDGPKPRQAKLAMVMLSDGGKDATEMREFNLETKSFVSGGFYVPPSKSRVGWVDANTLIVGTDATGDGAPEDTKQPWTDSGYPRTVRIWKRNTPIQQSKLVFEGEAADVAVSGYCYFDNHGTSTRFYEFNHRSMTFYTSEAYIKWPPAASPASPSDGTFIKVPIPDDASVSTFADQALISLRTAWEDAPGASSPFPAGALIACPLESLIEGKADVAWTVLFEPTEMRSLDGYGATKSRLIVSFMDNVKSRCQIWTLNSGKWETVGKVAGLGTDSFSLSAVDSDENDRVWITRSGFLSPSTLYVSDGDVDDLVLNASSAEGGDDLTLSLPARGPLYSLPSFFETEDLVATQRSCKSADGTVIPYFLIGKRETLERAAAAGGGDAADQPPCLVYGYGGFEIPMQAGYSASIGIGWLRRGGTFVEACIRGGGEFGPTWHQAALKGKRIKAYEDMKAVCDDVVVQKLARRGGVGIQGGSNGGLMVGNMLTHFPECFDAAVCQVPLLDMRRFHKLLAGASWMAEYGNPDEDWESWLERYSPYHQLGWRQCCADVSSLPPTLFTTSTRDDRVHPAHARKMVAKLLDLGSDKTFYYENIEGGHGGAANNEQRSFMKTLEYSFLWKMLSASDSDDDKAAKL